MNYDKQKPMSQNEIDEVNSIAWYRIYNIPTYPKNNVHLQISFDINIPYRVVRNDDHCSKENTWEVRGDNPEDYKVFANHKDAVDYCVRKYKKILELQLNQINKIIN